MTGGDASQAEQAKIESHRNKKAIFCLPKYD